MTTHFDFIQSAKRVIEIESRAIEGLYQYLDDNFRQACELMMQCTGKVIVCGMGKSGHVGRKIAATLASTGTSAFFMHPGEASHGDLGMLTKNDVVLAISNSGETSELLNLLPAIKRMAAPIIAMSGNPNSELGQHATVHLCIKVNEEACSLGLAPTSSTTATLVMGDALAVALLDAKGFTSDDFALSHPAGALGKKLLLMIRDIMHSGDALPLAHEQDTVSQALLEVSRKKLGMVAIVEDTGKLAGIFTDGDLRRLIDAEVDVHSTPIKDVMTRHGKTTTETTLAAEALSVMEKHQISGLIVIDDENQPIGAVNIQDFLRAGIV
jgi:arabinose-5-phosphate isomerase